MVQTKLTEKIKTHILYSVTFFPRKSCLFLNKEEKYFRAGQAMFIACWITNATNTHSEHVVPFAFPLQQRLNERPLVLRPSYITRRVKRCVYCAVRIEYLNIRLVNFRI